MEVFNEITKEEVWQQPHKVHTYKAADPDKVFFLKVLC